MRSRHPASSTAHQLKPCKSNLYFALRNFYSKDHTQAYDFAGGWTSYKIFTKKGLGKISIFREGVAEKEGDDIFQDGV